VIRTVRAAQLVIAFTAVLALVAGSSVIEGGRYVAFAVAVIAVAASSTAWVYREVARRWVLHSYELLLQCRLGEVRARVEAEREATASLIKRPLLELLRGEVLFWAGEHPQAYEAAKQLDVQQLPELWRGSAYELQLAAAAFTGRVAEARAVLDRHAAALRERPGFHQLEALVALREGDPAKARERWNSAPNTEPRPPLVRAALALLQAELAIAHGERPDAFVAEAIACGGESFVPQMAQTLPAHH
jgi:hypothetical protein